MEENQKAQQRDQWVLKIAMVVLIIYNLVFYLAEFKPHVVPSGVMNTYAAILKNRGMITFIEFIAVVALFVDLIVGYDKKKGMNRTLTLLITAVLLLAFFLKIFMTYLKAVQESAM